MSKEKVPNISADDYKHLDDASLEVFIKEFLIRNKEFMREITAFDERFPLFKMRYTSKESLKEAELLKQKYQVNFSISGKLPEGLKIDIGPAVDAMIVDHEVEGEEEWSEVAHFVFPYPNIIQERLILSINLERTRDEIEKGMKEQLDMCKDVSKTRARFTKWKYYIATYDVKGKYNLRFFSKVKDVMHEIFPSDDPDFTFEERKVEYYYKNALALINGGYKKYI